MCLIDLPIIDMAVEGQPFVTVDGQPFLTVEIAVSDRTIYVAVGALLAKNSHLGSKL